MDGLGLDLDLDLSLSLVEPDPNPDFPTVLHDTALARGIRPMQSFSVSRLGNLTNIDSTKSRGQLKSIAMCSILASCVESQEPQEPQDPQYDEDAA
eukprot:CAMPEP_0203671670 /NCGR_PEP_ID=MMETSP0090-20130426/7379_1 /ASSEMBLY_ACC=CAM_ASM_001088 /TAXON_ID=426623 /ORGANISM="Chaetoceros affinis, Strain CCMP159" /LENGTH=95 /DNA_ID=CAMNT_0050536785 /DNA_START=297 /DNA_END=584 /DNA_ORIENTATION=-